MSGTFRYRRRVQFAETDAAGIVHFSHAARYFEEAEHALMREVDQPAAENLRGGSGVRGFAKVSFQADFHAPLHAGEEIEVRLSFSEPAGRSLTWHFGIFRLDEPAEPAWTGSCVTLFCEMSSLTLRSLSIPEGFLDRLRDACKG